MFKIVQGLLPSNVVQSGNTGPVKRAEKVNFVIVVSLCRSVMEGYGRKEF